jgi:hypothetical protein
VSAANKAGTARASSRFKLNECNGEFAGFRANEVIFSHFSKALIFLLLFASRQKVEVVSINLQCWHSHDFFF